jgi:hypothetical protein
MQGPPPSAACRYKARASYRAAREGGPYKIKSDHQTFPCPPEVSVQAFYQGEVVQGANLTPTVTPVGAGLCARPFRKSQAAGSLSRRTARSIRRSYSQTS